MSNRKLDQTIYTSCLRKANLTEEEANRIVDLHAKENNRLMYYYKCPFCNSIHLTSNPPKDEIGVEVI